jgi:hypothetical protein
VEGNESIKRKAQSSYEEKSQKIQGKHKWGSSFLSENSVLWVVLSCVF